MYPCHPSIFPTKNPYPKSFRLRGYKQEESSTQPYLRPFPYTRNMKAVNAKVRKAPHDNVKKYKETTCKSHLKVGQSTIMIRI